MERSLWKNVRVYIKEKPVATFLVSAITIFIYFISTYLKPELLDAWCNHNYEVILGKEYYRIVTAMFLHGNVAHLVGNLLLFVSLGTMIEKVIGSFGWLFLYIASGSIANLVTNYYYLNRNEVHLAIGASGGVYGLLGALLFLVIIYQGNFQGFTIQRFFFVIIITIATAQNNVGVDNIAHMFGAIFGFVLAIVPAIIRKKKERDDETGRSNFEE